MNIEKISVHGREISPTFNLAIWETYAKSQKEKYWNLVIKKAKRVKHLQNVDLFGLSENEAKKTVRQIQYLEDELNILVGFKEVFENLQTAYLDTSVWLANYWKMKVPAFYEKRILEHKKNYFSINEAFEISANAERKYLNFIIEVLRECKERNINLESLKNFTL